LEYRLSTLRFETALTSRYSDCVAIAGSSEIFIDFEGNKDLPPTLLGVLERSEGNDTFHQYVLEDSFVPLATSPKHKQLLTGSIGEILEDLDARFSPETPIYAWSSHEQLVVNELLEGSDLAALWKSRITDAKKLAKQWARKHHPNHTFVKKEFRSRHTLDQYLSLIEYVVPTVHAAGRTGHRLRSLRETLVSARPLETWPPSLNRYWTNLLAHNMHDCYGMMAVIDRVKTDSLR
jgi:hypothetical protein